MVDVEAGLKYPLGGDGALKLHAIGGGVPVALNVLTGLVVLGGILFPPVWLMLLALVPAQLAVSVFWTGYFLRVASRTLAGATEPPAFDDWVELLVDGTRGFVVVLVYQVPGFVLTLVGYALVFLFVFGASFGMESGSESLAATSGVIGVLLLLLVVSVVMVYSLAAAYLMPISLVAYADEGRLGAAFSLETLKRVGLSKTYAEPWAAAAGAYFLVGTVTSVLTSLLIGYLLLPFLPLAYFYIGTAGFHMFGQAYAERTGKTPTAAGTSGQVASEPAAGTGSRQPEDV